MSHRKSLVASIALTFVLALGIFTARARLFESTTTGDNATATPATVVDTSADAIVSGEVQPAAETEQFTDERDDDEEDGRSLTRGERRDDDDREDEDHEDDDHDEDGEYDDD
jgi:hypothetical protein